MLVLVIMSVVTILASAAMYSTKMESLVSSAHKKSGNLYILAQAGANDTAIFITRLFNSLKETARINAISSIKKGNPYISNDSIENYLQFGITMENVNAYNKEFYLLYNNVPNIFYGVKYLEELDALMEQKLKQFMVIENLTSKVYNMSFIYEKPQDSSIEVDIELTVGSQKNAAHDEIKTYTIISTATDTSSDLYFKWLCVLDTTNIKDHIEKINEEYEWREGESNYFKNAITSFGDILLENSELRIGYEDDSIIEDTRHNIFVKGTIPKFEMKNEFEHINEGDEFGGIKVTDGSKLYVNGDVYTNSAIQTKRKYYNGEVAKEADAKIYIQGDVVANSVAIEDNFYLNGKVYGYSNEIINENVESDLDTYSDKHDISITGDVYLDDKIYISKYCNDSNIWIGGDLYGVGGNEKSPNNSSSIYNKGAGESLITIEKDVYINGYTFLIYEEDNVLKQIKLLENIGVPYEPLIDELLEVDNSDYYKNSHIDCDKIFFSKGFFKKYASANGKSYAYPDDSNEILPNAFKHSWRNPHNSNYVSLVNNVDDSKYLFNEGLRNNKALFNDKVGSLISNDINESDLLENRYIGPIFVALTGLNEKWGNTKLQDGFTIRKTIYTEGIEGYMDYLRDLNDFNFQNDTKIGLLPHSWDYNEPYIFTTDAREIDISEFYVDDRPIPTIIISTDTVNPLKIKVSDSSKNKFKGLIVSNSKIKIEDEDIIFEGIIITKSNYEITNDHALNIENGNSAALHIKNSNIQIIYNSNLFLEASFKNNATKRKILDYLLLTGYKDISNNTVVYGRNNIRKNLIKELAIKNSSPIVIKDLPPIELNMAEFKQYY